MRSMKEIVPCQNSQSLLLVPPIFPHYIVYINDLQYQSYILGMKSFYLIFELSSRNRKHLLSVLNDCIQYRHFKGLVFLIDKNEILFDRLFFLRNLILKLVQNGKYTSIWGLPYCTEQTILGMQDYSKYAPYFIAKEGEYFSKYTPTYQQDSSLLLKCKECFNVDHCDGLGSRSENHHIQGYRTSHTYRKRGRDILFKTHNKEMQKLYDSFSHHVDGSDLRYADRYLYFVTNVDFGSSYSFTDRFVYHCDYIPMYEYQEELRFLEIHVTNRKIIPMLRTLADEEEVCRLAYSKAVNEKVSRESFYMNPNGEYNYYLLKFFHIDLNLNFPNRFLGLGVDFHNAEIKAYKVYLMLPVHVLVNMFPQYLEKINVDLSILHEKEHFYILRLDKDKKKISERIDIVYNDKDRQALKKYLPYTDDILDILHVFALAFEFESMEITKMNIYYKNRF